jgi:hypothetical protein
MFGAARQRQGPVLDYLPRSTKANKPGNKDGSEAEHLFASGG